MIKIYNVAIAAALVFGLSFLGGCQLSQTGSSTHLGNNLAATGGRLSVQPVGPQRIVVDEDADTYQSIVASKPAVKDDAKPATRKSTKTLRKKPAHKKSSKKKFTKKSGKVSKRKNVKSKKSGSYDSIIRRHAKENGVPYALARAVVQVESGFRPNARGKVGEVGLMQLRSRTARGMGYRGSVRALYNPEINIKYGMRYLGKAYKLGGRSTCGAILKYNAGHGAKRMNPISRRYCGKVQKILRRKG